MINFSYQIFPKINYRELQLFFLVKRLVQHNLGKLKHPLNLKIILLAKKLVSKLDIALEISTELIYI